MTSATTILGLLPMAIGLGEGAELRAPLAITVIGGLSVATLLTLVVIPVVYSLVDRKEVNLALAVQPGADATRGPRARRHRASARGELMQLPRLAVKRPITTAMMLISVLVLGGIAIVRFPWPICRRSMCPLSGSRSPIPTPIPRRSSGRSSNRWRRCCRP